MVLYFEPRGCEPGGEDFSIYMGRDKFENEDLIRYGLPNDLWFHVDDLSSAHVYLRLPEGVDMDHIPPDTLEDCCQLVKANSIQGNKQAVGIVYTPWSNLKKTKAMEVGQVSFHSLKNIRKCKVEKRSNEIVNRLNRTKREDNPDLAARREAYDQGVRQGQKAERVEAARAEKEARSEASRQAELRSYSSLMQEENMTSNASMAERYKSVEEYEEDFM
mmetsp:Transcript_7415/g.21892  ORF Transcript_7415/g.21892 Transcript_7415/m.21892 type:complete len:218 (-) Transcript_7415:5497-6150(-)